MILPLVKKTRKVEIHLQEKIEILEKSYPSKKYPSKGEALQ